jgi:hypothetical protein
MTLANRVEEILAILHGRDNLYPSDTSLKALVKAEFLRGAAAAFSACWRGEESVQCLAAAEAIDEPTAT